MKDGLKEEIIGGVVKGGLGDEREVGDVVLEVGKEKSQGD